MHPFFSDMESHNSLVIGVVSPKGAKLSTEYSNGRDGWRGGGDDGGDDVVLMVVVAKVEVIWLLLVVMVETTWC